MSSAIDMNSTNETFTNDEVRNENFIRFTIIHYSIKENLIEEEKEEVYLPMDAIVSPSEEPTNSQSIKEETDTPSESSTQPSHDQSLILEGKRSRKPTSLFNMSQLITSKKEFSIPQVTSLFPHLPGTEMISR